ncbi:hypothetical protein OZD68_04790 [Wolbachia endosymbiont of Drosophila bicornuta]|uniref:hypothetical protein n=1 Tax=Wolbachia TaxID=953 RepID=UPI0015F99707|nr:MULTISPECIES: hypothetical protein [Wolbachia]MBA8755231.1 hypothetical protein [Wolbachia pipientis]MDE5056886.1 hypothetical protein [Wolbachia endosymbiont of Drosophila bicornuta]
MICSDYCKKSYKVSSTINIEYFLAVSIYIYYNITLIIILTWTDRDSNYVSVIGVNKFLIYTFTKEEIKWHLFLIKC